MSLLEQIQAKKGLLKPTETVVRPLPICQAGLEAAGLECLGGEIEEERNENEQDTVRAAVACAAALRNAQHAVVYTGAGVSTATGITDYRGPDGVWTLLATGRIPDDTFDYTGAAPSYTHMAIAKLINAGFLKFCTSTNLDALHYKSGLRPLTTLAELHGNKFCERCPDCQDEVLRPFPIRRTPSRATGRYCSCGGAYMDSGIDFGQSLPVRQLELAEEQARRSDFSLVLGTSMRVRPASDLPFLGEHVASDGADGDSTAQACIVNRQDTPFDKRAAIRSFGDADLFCFHLTRELGLQVDVPPSCEHLRTATQMKRLAAKFLPPHDGHFVGEEELEKRMSEALDKTEAELLQ